MQNEQEILRGIREGKIKHMNDPEGMMVDRDRADDYLK
mgnify:CR=1 FL=1